MELPLFASPLAVDVDDVPDLTETLQSSGRRVLGTGAFGTVYSTVCTRNGEVAVKAITFPPDIDQTEKDEFVRKIRRELGIWRRLEHPNIVPLLGKARGDGFASDHPCMVSMLMPCGTLLQYVGYATRSERSLPLSGRIRLIQGLTAGLEYLHSKTIVHGDFHPGNVLIDSDHNARVTDFGFSQTLTRQDHLTYLFTQAPRPGARMWVAPELLWPDLFEDLQSGATLSSDIYSLGSIILFTLSGKLPWDKAEFETRLEKQSLDNPSPPVWPIISDVAWEFLERCWSPQVPNNRPLAQEVLSFTTDKLEQLLQPNPASDINVVLFGALGCGKSSIINLLAGEPIAPVSKNIEPCTKRPQDYWISIGERRFHVWDTTGFRLPRGGVISHLSPYEQAHTVLRDLSDGVHLILLCASKDDITSLRNLYWLTNNFFFGGQAPLALVVTHVGNPKKQWEQCERNISKNTGIPIHSIPHVCTTTAPNHSDHSGKKLRSFLENFATSGNPIPLRLDLSSYGDAPREIAAHCGLTDSDAAKLVAHFRKPRNPLNVVLFGKAGSGKSSVVNLVAGTSVAEVSSDIEACTLDPSSYVVDTSTGQFLVWDTIGFNGVRNGHDMTSQAVLSAVQLIRNLASGNGVDLLVFVKNCGKLTASELNCYRFFEEFLCEGQVPVAVVITHLEDHEWWEMNGHAMLAVMNGNVIGHACITPMVPGDTKFSETLSESRTTVQALFEKCVSFPKGEEISVQLRTKSGGGTNRVPDEITVENLMNQCGLAKELAKEVIRLVEKR